MTIAVLALATPSLPVPERRVLLPFDYEGVRVTHGLLKKQLEETKEFYLRIPNDDLLLPYRRRAKLPAPGHELGGWYSDDVFHIFGQVLSGLARIYRATGDLDCKNKADALLDGWEKCIGRDGYFYADPPPNAYHYIYDKMVGGLVDMALYCGRKDAFGALAKITGWAEKNLDRCNVYAGEGEASSTEWYTLSENLYRAYLATGDDRYAKFAKVWEYTDYWKLYATRGDLFGKRADGGQTSRYHAYSHVNNLGGAALAYRVTGDSWYLDTIKNAYDYLLNNECFATGGYGPDESLVRKERLEEMLRSTTATFETQCGTWAVFKLCKSLIALTGDAKYGNWAEELAYNGIGATIPEDANGDVFYYSSYNPFGAVKRNHWDPWSCCAGTRPIAIADVCDLIYFHAGDGIDVNLFVPSTATFEVRGAHVQIEQQTRFPEEGRTQLLLKLDRPATFAIRFRKADWLAGSASAKVNGASATLSEENGHWLTLSREWKDGDRIELELPMAFRSVPLYPEKTYPTAIAYGPVVMAFRSDSGSPADKVDLSNVPANFLPVAGDSLNYRLRSDESVLVRPFYDFKEGEPYTMYLDPSAAGRIGYVMFKKGGRWQDSGKFCFTNEVGAWCEGSFSGTGVRLLGFKYDDAGHCEVRIDGTALRTIDQFGPGRDLPGGWDFTGLTPGTHTIRVTVLSEKSAQSKDRFINVAGIQVLK